METLYVPAWKQRILRFLDGTRCTLFMTLVTLWALFGDDVRLMAFHAGDDPMFVGLVYVCLALFSAEMCLMCLAKRGYVGTFYFWLDLIATLSLLMDVPEFMALIDMAPCAIESDAWAHGLRGHDEGGGTEATADSAVARAGRASRAGTRAGRIVRLVRLVRIVKLYKTWQTRRRNSKDVVAGSLARAAAAPATAATPPATPKDKDGAASLDAKKIGDAPRASDEDVDEEFATPEVRSIHWSPYDRVGVVNADP
ncbi:uncharacterized protein MICPUCDRAFT_38834 [Micromonas pusilla CCMP1545]|uniref:Predicted protein n=1 Tax=Micromonas pusilla (strain CCMP1545) TaxID=564608 RepID=C1MM71_MICPC|nr:uncharacterized protein MICPUCDRAFT_38834 [Micromonas pusilla CCMP1545]EEH58528.1 predicted protein [Micromonas pusilla CCMP1545]|eukprot:XP_003056883.1 predicted protein [Micromonas pusilla CCMP1545]